MLLEVMVGLGNHICPTSQNALLTSHKFQTLYRWLNLSPLLAQILPIWLFSTLAASGRPSFAQFVDAPETRDAATRPDINHPSTLSPFVTFTNFSLSSSLWKTEEIHFQRLPEAYSQSPNDASLWSLSAAPHKLHTSLPKADKLNLEWIEIQPQKPFTSLDEEELFCLLSSPRERDRADWPYL